MATVKTLTGAGKVEERSIFDLAPVRTAIADIPTTLHAKLVPFDGRGRRDSFRFDLDTYGTLTIFAYGDAAQLDGLTLTAADFTWATQDAKRMVKGEADRRKGERDGYAVYVTMPMGVAKALGASQTFVLSV